MDAQVTTRPSNKALWVLNPRDHSPLKERVESFVVTHKASEKFINCIQDERKAGYGFIPIIGAGFSAPSGAPLVWDLGPYLQRCIWLALGNDGPDGHRWHPRTDQWPPFLDRRQTVQVSNYRQKLQRLLAEEEKSTKKEKPKLPVLIQAIGATAEWRTSLLFLSRLKHEPRNRNNKFCAASLGASRPEIIDSCLRHVLKGKNPSLNHVVLGVLAGALRLNLILTTNFDDLLERAFAETRNPLQVFEVHLGDHLPHWSAVSDVRSLVKFHGNRHSLRADYSLDAEPSGTDKARFLEYLLAGRNPGDAKVGAQLPFQNHVLMIGVGGDERTLELIRHAGSRLSKGFKVFWLCYSDDDIARVRKLADSCSEEYGSSGCPQFIVLKHTNQGLLLLQLYQVIRQSLPPFGGLFPSVSRVTVPPLRQVLKEIPGRSFCQEVDKRLQEMERTLKRKPRLLFITANKTLRGMTSACIEVFCHLEASHVCLWLDMNDISSADNLFEVLLEAVYFRLGQENWVPTYRETDIPQRTKEIAHVMSSAGKPWIIFLNARETPGANTPKANVFDQPHGWLDQGSDKDDRSSCARAFVELITRLCKSGPVSVVLMCRNRKRGLRSGLMAELARRELFDHHHHMPLRKGMREIRPFSEATVVAEAIRWTKGNPRKLRFLYALVLMQRPRLLATIWSGAVLHGRANSRLRLKAKSNQRQEWLEELEKAGLVRRKAGGFIWLHSRCRELIRQVFRDPGELRGRQYEDARKILKRWKKRRRFEPEIHTRLARWYEKVLDASGSPAAVFEAVYHQCRAADGHLELAKDSEDGIEKACQRLDAATALLKVNSFLLQTQGYPRGSWRRLAYTRDDLCVTLAGRQNHAELASAAQRLRVTCTEVMRAIAQEVGEDKQAYSQHQQFGILHTQTTVTKLQQGSKHVAGKGKISRALLAAFQSTGDETSTLPVILRGSVAADERARSAEWVRWWRWSGMLATSTRSYGSALSAFRRALHCVAFPLSYESPQDIAIWPLEDDKETKKKVEASSPALKIEALRTLEQYVELELIMYGLDERLGVFKGGGDSKERERTLNEIELQIARGRDLASNIRGGNDPHDPRHTVEANWCESRLLMHRSVCLSRRRQLETSEEIYRPLGFLSDAEAILRISDPRRHSSDIAIVELHRAQGRLWAAEVVSIRTSRREERETFGQLCRSLDDQLTNASRPQLARLRRRYASKDAVAGIRRAKSLVADGIHFLDRVEPMLRERRRNVWWTGWFFERYLRSIAMSVWASVFEEASAIPFLGLEAAASGTATLADELLFDASRMISVDTFRMATIIDAYASSARALQIRLMFDETCPRLDSRLGTMREKVREALKELTEVERRRDDAASSRRDKKTKPDHRIEEYIRLTRQQSQRICDGLELQGRIDP